ncbi:MAG TPA: class I SAM-dependent methyltransferase [Candidatus Lokiarchaeia archaeon]|nr:class I SAM-dependent methyltransferase [Candidatus Lokiarchaeia archaeon]
MSNFSRDAAFFRKTQELYDEIAPEFDRSRGKEPWHPLVQFIEFNNIANELASVHYCTAIMDVGCGNGRNLPLLAKTFSRATCIGIDLSSTLLITAGQFCKDLPRASFVQGSMTHLPFRQASHGVIACVAALHHSPSKESMGATLDQIRDTLKTGGLMFLSTWAKWQPRFRWQVLKNITLLKRRPGLVNVPWKATSGGPARDRHYFLLSLSELRKLVNKQFAVINATMLGGKGNRDNIFILARAR